MSAKNNVPGYRQAALVRPHQINGNVASGKQPDPLSLFDKSPFDHVVTQFAGVMARHLEAACI